MALPPCSAGFRPTFTRCRFGPTGRVASRPWHPRPAVVRCLTEATQPPMIRSHVVVDGSNIATEGRTTPEPSSARRRRARRSSPSTTPRHLTVVVDATFPTASTPPSAPSTRRPSLAGELVTPPAGRHRPRRRLRPPDRRQGRRHRPVQRLLPGVPRRATRGSSTRVASSAASPCPASAGSSAAHPGARARQPPVRAGRQEAGGPQGAAGPGRHPGGPGPRAA